MPVIPILTAIAAIAGVAGTGVSIYEGIQQQDTQKDALKAQQKLANQQNQLREKEAFLAASPNAQAQTGGSLTGQAGQSFADVLAGLPSYYGREGQGGQPGGQQPPSLGGGQPNYQDLLATLSQFQSPQQQGGDFSGGFQPPQPPQQGRFNLSTLNL